MDAVNSAYAPLADELKRLSRTVNDLEGAFRLQRETLKKSGMSLPPGTLAGIQSIHTDLDTLATQLENERTELSQLRALGQTAELINSTLNLDEVLNGVINAAIRLTDAERGYLVLRNAAGEMEFRVARNITGVLGEGQFIISRSILNQVARTGNPVLTDNASEEGGQWGTTESVVIQALRSILCVPLLLRGDVTGVIYVDNRIKRGIFGEKEKELLYAFANQAAVAIENARLFERARTNLAQVTAVKNLMDNVFASIGSGVITTDAQDQITTFNDAAQRILNIAEGDGLGALLWSVLPPLSDGFKRMVHSALVNNEQNMLEAELEIPERGEVSLNLKLSPLKNSAQLTQGVAIVVDDVTELKERNAQLRTIRRYLPPAMVDNIQSIDQLGLGGERREVTTMFIDVRGFSSFPRNLNPQEFMQTLNDYLTIASDEVSQQTGVIDKYMANEVMALFNTQLNPAEDHAWRAILAALNMVDAYLDFYHENGEDESTRYYRMGIHTGIATLGNAGSKTRKEFTAIGDAINVAHRLLENARDGQILISRQTYEECSALFAAHPEIQVVDCGEIQVKGRQQSVNILEVFREAPHV